MIEVNNPLSAQALQLQRAALETSAAVLQRQRRLAIELEQAKVALETLTKDQAHALSLLHSTLESSPDAVAAFNMNGRLIAYNQTYVNIWQISPALVESGDSNALLAYLKTQVVSPESLDLWSNELYSQCLK